MIRFILGGAGSGKSEYMMNLIENTLNDRSNDKQICIIVPEQFSFEYEKKLYLKLGAKRYNAVNVISFTRLALDIFGKYGGSKGTHDSDLAKVAMMQLSIRKTLEQDGFLFYSRQAKNAGFVTQALDIVQELHHSGVTAEMLMLKLPFLKDDIYDKTFDIANIYTAYEKQLSENGIKDSLNDILDSARLASSKEYFAGFNVFLDEFQGFTADEYEMLEAVISTAHNTCLTLTTEDVPTAKESMVDTSVFAIANQTFLKIQQIAVNYSVPIKKIFMKEILPFSRECAPRFKVSALSHLSKNILRNSRDVVESENIRIIESLDIYTEIEVACAEICRLVHEENYKFGDIAIISRQLSDYIGSLEGACSRYEIPYFLDAQVPIMHKSLIILVLSVLENTSSRKFNTEAILRYAKTGLLAIPYSRIAGLENYCYKWNVNGEAWLEDFTIDIRENSTINDTRKLLVEPLLTFKKAIKKATTGRIICENLYKLFVDTKLPNSINTIVAAQEFSVDGQERELSTSQIDINRLEVSRELKQLWGILLNILDVIHDSFGDMPMTGREFGDTIKLMLNTSSIATPPQTLDAVTVASVERSRLNAPKVVFVLGVNEGIMPYAVKQSGLFSERDKTQLSGVDIKLNKTIKHMLAEERFITYSAVSFASERLYLSYPLSDNAGRARFPSYIVMQIIKMFSGISVTKASDLGLLYFCRTEHSAYYNFTQNYNKSNEQAASLRYVLEGLPNYKHKLAYLDALDLNAEQHINDVTLTKALFSDKLTLSASRFEDYNKCPFSYFCKKGLGIYPRQRIEMNGMEQGNIIHKCMCEIFKSYDNQSFISAKPCQFTEQIHAVLDSYYTEIFGGDFGKTARFNANYNELLDTILEILLHLQVEFSQSEFIPTDFELRIAEGSEINPIKLVSGSGIEITFIGTVDRVDCYRKGQELYIRVVDYKSGEKQFRLEDVFYGINMQMLLYLFAVADSEKYSGAIPSGVLYMPSKVLSPVLERGADEKDTNHAKDKAFKMSGLLLEDEALLNAMEHGIGGVYIPAKKIKDSFSKTSSLVTKKQMNNLKKHSHALLISMCERLYKGEIGAVPLVNGKFTPCSYCDYWSVCGRTSIEKKREYAADSKEQLKKILDGGDEFEQMD